MKSSNMRLALALGLVAVASAGNPPGYFKGVRNNVSTSTLKGWKQAYYASYGANQNYGQAWYNTIYAHVKDGANWVLLGASRDNNKSVLTVAAMCESKTLFNGPSFKNVGANNRAIAANGAYWYYVSGKSIGFSPGATVSLNTADTNDSGGAQYKMSWHFTGTGWRAGASKSIGNGWSKHVWVYKGGGEGGGGDAAYMFKGIKLNLAVSALSGWERVYHESYTHASHLTFINGYGAFYNKVKDSKYLLFGAYKDTNPKTLTLAAICDRNLLFAGPSFKTVGTNSRAVANNGAYWYFGKSKSIGFSPGTTVSLNSADTNDSGGAQYKLSWHLSGGGGWRAGSTKGIGGGWHKVVYISKGGNSCKCMGGKAAQGKECPKNGYAKCVSCDEGKYLKDAACYDVKCPDGSSKDKDKCVCQGDLVGEFKWDAKAKKWVGGCSKRGAQPNGFFKGMKQNVAVSSLSGWTRVYHQRYDHASHKTFVDGYVNFYSSVKDANWLLFGAYKSGNANTLQVAGIVERKLFFESSRRKDIGNTSTAVANNGGYWYFVYRKSIGFSMASKVSLNSADTYGSPDWHRMSWHLSGGGGWRAGSNLSISSSHYKVVYKWVGGGDDGPKKCVCKGGTPVPDAKCPKNGANVCASCSFASVNVGGNCVAVPCPQGTKRIGNYCNCDPERYQKMALKWNGAGWAGHCQAKPKPTQPPAKKYTCADSGFRNSSDCLNATKGEADRLISPRISCGDRKCSPRDCCQKGPDEGDDDSTSAVITAAAMSAALLAFV